MHKLSFSNEIVRSLDFCHISYHNLDYYGTGSNNGDLEVLGNNKHLHYLQKYTWGFSFRGTLKCQEMNTWESADNCI